MARARISPVYWYALGGAVLAYLYYQKEAIVAGVQAVSVWGKEQYFDAVLPAYAQPYASAILAASKATGVDPFTIFALGDRESGWGQYLSPPGPGGTGDSTHGRGLMQIDDRTWASWLASNDWTDPATNVLKGAQILKSDLDFFAGTSPIQGLVDASGVYLPSSVAAARGVAPGYYPDPRPLSGDALTQAALAAYNTGMGNVLYSIAAGLSPDATTTQGNYATDVAQRASQLASEFEAAVA